MSHHARPVVSVLMPVFNAAPTVSEALRSMLNQTLSSLEVIVVNDGSTDGTMEAVGSFRDPRIIIVHNPENLGLAASLNVAIRVSSGGYLARMDADDSSAAERLEKQVAFMEKNPHVDIVGSALQYFGYSSHLEKFPGDDEACKARLLFNVCFGHPSVLFRRRVFDREENYYDPGLRQYSEEYDLWCRLAPRHKFANLPEPLVLYRTYPPFEKSRDEEQRIRNSERIRYDYLVRLFGPVSPEQFEMHSKLARLSRVSSDELAGVLQWLDELETLNGRVRAFNPETFGSQLAERFFALCYVNPRVAGNAFQKSKWKAYYRPAWTEELKLVVKSLTEK